MATLVTPGDRQIMVNGSLSSLSRNSVPFSMFTGSVINRSGGGTLSYQQLYEQQPWAHTVINKMSRQIARLPLKVFEVQDNGDRERVRVGPVPDLLGAPYPRASASTLKQKIAWPMLVHGNSVLLKVRPAPGAPPTQLFPLDWRYLVPRLDFGYELLFWETTQFGETIRLAKEDVVHFAWEAGRGEMGLSPLLALGITFQAEDAIQRSQASTFNNGVRSSGAFVIPAEARTTKDQRDELREHIAASQGGVDNAGRPLLLFNGAKFESTQQTAVEVQLIEQRKLNREEIAACYDMPPPMIGILDKATHSNITEQHKILYTDVLGPWLTHIEETLEAQLIRMEPAWENLRVEFDLAEVLRGDLLQEMQAIKEAIGTGVMTPNEGRAIRNMAPVDVPGADEIYLPTNNLTPLGTPVAPADSVTSPTKAIERHLERAKDRMRRKGNPDLDRFERELAADTGDAQLAAEWKELLSGHVADGGDPVHLEVHVAPPEVKFDKDSVVANVTVEPAQITVESADVTVHAPKPPDVHVEVHGGKVTKRVERDATGQITAIHETPEV